MMHYAGKGRSFSAMIYFKLPPTGSDSAELEHQYDFKFIHPVMPNENPVSEIGKLAASS